MKIITKSTKIACADLLCPCSYEKNRRKIVGKKGPEHSAYSPSLAIIVFLMYFSDCHFVVFFYLLSLCAPVQITILFSRPLFSTLFFYFSRCCCCCIPVLCVVCIIFSGLCCCLFINVLNNSSGGSGDVTYSVLLLYTYRVRAIYN